MFFYCIPCKRNITSRHESRRCKTKLQKYTSQNHGIFPTNIQSRSLVKWKGFLLLHLIYPMSTTQRIEQKLCKPILWCNTTFPFWVPSIWLLYTVNASRLKYSSKVEMCSDQDSCYFQKWNMTSATGKFNRINSNRLFLICNDGSNDSEIKKMNPVSATIFDANNWYTNTFHDMCVITWVLQRVKLYLTQ